MTMIDGGTTVDLDIGGTFTDCFVRLADGRTAAVKTPTTAHRLAVGFTRALEMAAAELGTELDKLLADTSMLRYSTTVALNMLLQRNGPRLALVTTAGFEDTMAIGRGASWMDAAVIREIRNVARITKPVPLIPGHMIIGAQERIDSFGHVVQDLDEDRFIGDLRRVVDFGARGFVVVLLFSYINPVHEQRIRALIETEFPEAYLGSMPIMLSSEVCPKRWEYTRTNTTVLNAYLHQAMWEELSGMSDELRSHGYERSIMMVHNTGGMGEVYRTSALQTFNSGPVAGLIGAATIGRQLGYENVLVADMGGTSFDIGLVNHGSPRSYQYHPTLDRFWVDMTMLETRSIGAGGGSIAWLNDAVGNRLEVGPQSAGSMPGPVALGLGGRQPTVTDADVVLGFINPNRYHGGDIRLDRKRAERAIEEQLGKPLGISMEDAAWRVKRIVDANMADILARETYLRGYDPREYVLFAYGGAGPTHCTGFGRRLGLREVVVFPFSPIFCAWGASTMPLVHIYEASRRIQLLAPRSMQPLENYDEFNSLVENLESKALRDVAREGLDPASAMLTLELDMKYGGQIHVHRMNSPRLRLGTPGDVDSVAEEFAREYAAFYSPILVYPEGGLEIHNFVLKATVAKVLQEQAMLPPAESEPTPVGACCDVYWGLGRGWLITPIFEQDNLQPGHAIAGPSIVEASYTSTVVDPDCSLTVDRHGNLVIALPVEEVHL